MATARERLIAPIARVSNVMRNRSAAALTIASAILASRAAIAQSHDVCIVPNRAIVYYDQHLYAIESGKSEDTLPKTVIALHLQSDEWLERPIVREACIWTEDLHEYVDGTQNLRYLSATENKRITMVRGKSEERVKHVKWIQHVITSKKFGKNYDSDRVVFQIESIANKQTTGCYISVSKERTEIKVENGTPLALCPLVLGDKKSATTFERVDELTK